MITCDARKYFHVIENHVMENHVIWGTTVLYSVYALYEFEHDIQWGSVGLDYAN